MSFFGHVVFVHNYVEVIFAVRQNIDDLCLLVLENPLGDNIRTLCVSLLPNLSILIVSCWNTKNSFAHFLSHTYLLKIFDCLVGPVKDVVHLWEHS